MNFRSGELVLVDTGVFLLRHSLAAVEGSGDESEPVREGGLRIAVIGQRTPLFRDGQGT
jgi:hypothetical protein